MPFINPAFEAFQRRRFTRPDAARWLSKDAGHYFKCGQSSAETREVESKRPPSSAPGSANDSDGVPAGADLHRAYFELLSLRGALISLKLRHLLRKALPPDGGAAAEGPLHYLTQPRVPRGNPDGGEWTAEGVQQSIRVAQANSTVTDAAGNPYYRSGGHHEVPVAVYKKWNLRPETRAVFNGSTTGSVPGIFRSTPNGVRQGNFWDGPEGLHGDYNRAVREFSERFMVRNGITPEQMTPDHATALMKEIRETEEPRIRTFNNAIRLIQRLYKLRTGRGLE